MRLLGNCLQLQLLVEKAMNPLYIFSTVGIEIKYLNKLLSFPTEWGDNRIGVSDRSIIPDDRFTASSTIIITDTNHTMHD